MSIISQFFKKKGILKHRLLVTKLEVNILQLKERENQSYSCSLSGSTSIGAYIYSANRIIRLFQQAWSKVKCL